MIDTATQSDIPALAEMLQQLNALHAASLPHRFHDNGSDTGRQAFFSNALAAGAQILVYRIEGVARGYLLWKPRPPVAATLERPRRVALLDHIYVEPIRRHRGIGTRLIARFEDDLRAAGYDGWATQVHMFNAASRGLMREMGAAPAVEVLEKRFQTPERSNSAATMPP